MKKVLSICAIALIAVMILSLAACGAKMESGTYTLVGMTENGEKANEEALAQLQEDGSVPTLVVDGEYAYAFGKTFTIEDGRLKTSSGDVISYTVSGSKVTLSSGDRTMVFEKK